MLEGARRVPKLFRPEPQRFGTLNLGMLLATAIQTYILVACPGWGVDVNTDGALWGPLFLSTLAQAVYVVATIAVIDWGQVGGEGGRGLPGCRSCRSRGVEWIGCSQGSHEPGAGR